MLLYVPHKLIQENRFQKRTDYGDIPGLAASIASMYDVYPPNTRGLQQVPGARLILNGEVIKPEATFDFPAQKLADGSIVEMVEKLRDAAAYIRGIEQKEQEKAQSEGTLMQVLADNAAACDECSEPWFEKGDGVACSCGAARGAVLCEDCYVEHGHMAHDTNPDNAWMKEMEHEN